MKRDALAFFRILPAGTADIGEAVTRDDLREAGAGQWFVGERQQDDVSCIFGPAPVAERLEDYDTPVPLNEAPASMLEGVVELRFKDVG